MLRAGRDGMSRPVNVLFLCTGNSARSIIAEALLNHEGGGRFRAFSAGSHPRGEVHPAALAVLAGAKIPVAGLRSKSWAEFAESGSPRLDLVITVCGNAAGETCPIWPGSPARAHWDLDDPAAVDGEGQRAAFEQTLRLLRKRISDLTGRELVRLDRDGLGEAAEALRRAGLPFEDLDGPALEVFRLDGEAGPLGWAALERHGADALLRSVVVAEARRGTGAGGELVARVARRAAGEGVERLWLLTETAAPFFAGLGFAPITRGEAPEPIRRTGEFSGLCPDAAVCMTKRLTG